MPAGREPKPSKTSLRYFCPFLPTLANSELRCVWAQAVIANRLQIGPAVTVQKGHTNTPTCSPRIPWLPSGRCLCCHLSFPPWSVPSPASAASSKLTPSLLTVCLTSALLYPQESFPPASSASSHYCYSNPAAPLMLFHPCLAALLLSSPKPQSCLAACPFLSSLPCPSPPALSHQLKNSVQENKTWHICNDLIR